jgi:hypothetical protein
MTMGNHECLGGGYCSQTSGDANSYIFRQALAPISKTTYYSFDVTTRLGIARFVIVADNSWDAQQQQWLQDTLSRADKEAKYTIVARHHPIDNQMLSNPQEWQIIHAHKYSLFLTGHSHTYRHENFSDPSGRTVLAGNGGAPLDNHGSFYGYGTVEQRTDGNLYVTFYDQASGMVQDSFSVAPQ